MNLLLVQKISVSVLQDTCEFIKSWVGKQVEIYLKRHCRIEQLSMKINMQIGSEYLVRERERETGKGFCMIYHVSI